MKNPAFRKFPARASIWLLLAAAAVSALLCPRSASAQTAYTLTNTPSGGSWAATTNWNPNGTPGGNAGDIAILPLGTLAAAWNMSLNSSPTIAGFSMTSAGAFGVTLNPGTPATSALTLHGANPAFTNNVLAGQTLTIAAPFSLDTASTLFTNNGSGNLTISTPTNGFFANLNPAGGLGSATSLTLNNVYTNLPPLTQLKTGAGQLTLALVGAATNTFFTNQNGGSLGGNGFLQISSVSQFSSAAGTPQILTNNGAGLAAGISTNTLELDLDNTTPSAFFGPSSFGGLWAASGKAGLTTIRYIRGTNTLATSIHIDTSANGNTNILNLLGNGGTAASAVINGGTWNVPGNLYFAGGITLNIDSNMGSFTNGSTLFAGSGNSQQDYAAGNNTINFNPGATVPVSLNAVTLNSQGGSVGIFNVLSGSLTNLGAITLGVTGHNADNSTSTLNVSGGMLGITNSGGIQTSYVTTAPSGSVGPKEYSFLTITNTGVLSVVAPAAIKAGSVTQPDTSTAPIYSQSTISLGGGTLQLGAPIVRQPVATMVNAASANWVQFYFNGGTLLVTTNLPQLFTGFGTANSITDAVYVASGGAVINNGGWSVGISNNLLAASGSTGGLTTLGSGTLSLSGSNTFTGPTYIAGGTLVVSNQYALQNSTLNYTNGTVVFGNNSTAYTLGGLAGTVSLGLTNAGGTAIALSLGGSNSPTTYGGVLSGAGALTLQSGTFNLTNNNTYTGVTTISGGTLAIGGAGQLGSGTYSALISNNGTLNDNSSAAQALSGIISGAGALTDNGAGTLTLSGADTYTGATTVNGGMLLVNSPGSLAAGAVTVNNGILGGNGTINGTVNLSAGSVLAPGGLNTVGTLTLAANSTAALMLNGNTLLFDLSNVAGTSDLVATTKTNVVNSANIIVLNAPTGAVPAGGYTLMTYTAKTGSGTLTFPNGTTNMYNAVLTNGPTGVTLGVLTGGLTGQDTWQGNASGVWDNSAANWVKNGTGSSTYAAGDAVTFDDTASGNFTVSSVSTVSPASVLFNNNTNNYTINANITGSAPLLKIGTGTVTLGGINTYTGGTTISAGTLALANGARGITNNGTVLFNNPATLNLGGNSQTLANLSFGNLSAGTATVTNGNLTITGGNWTPQPNPASTVATTEDLSGLTTLSYTSGSQLYFYGTLGANSTNKLAGTNNFTLSNLWIASGGLSAATPSYTESVLLGQSNLINAANIQLGGYHNCGAFLGFNSGLNSPTLTLRGESGGVNPVGTFYIGNNSNGSFPPAAVDTTAGSIDAIISTFELIWASTGGQTCYMSMSNGTFNVGSLLMITPYGGATGTFGGVFNQNGGTVLAGLLDINNNINTTATSGPLTSTYNLGNGSASAGLLSAKTISTVETMPNAASRATLNFINGTIENYDPALGQPGSAAAAMGSYATATNLTISGLAGGGAATNDCRTLNIVLAATGTHNLYAESGYSIIEQPTALISGAGSLNVNGPGMVVFDGGTNTYSGITTVTNGTLKIVENVTGESALGTAPGSAVANQLTLNGGTLALNQGWAGTFSGFSAGTGYTNFPTVTLNQVSGASILAQGGIAGIRISSAGNVLTNVTVIITPPDQVGGVQATATATAGVNFTTGGGLTSITIGNAGSGYTVPPLISFTLNSGATTPVANVTNVTLLGLVNANPGYDYTGTAPTVSFGGGGGSGASATASATATAAITLSANRGLTLGAAGGTIDILGNHTINGVITGNGTLAKTGTGTLTLANANSYAGNTVISAGTLALGSSGSLNASSSINIAAGATFDVSGPGASATYALGSGASLTASGTTSAATIKGGSSGTVSLGSQGVTLNFDGSDTPLTVSQGTLSLSGNIFTVVTASTLAPGIYTLVSTPNNISGTVNPVPSYTGGSGVVGGATGVVSVNGHSVILTVSGSITATQSANGMISPSGTTTVTYGANQTFTITPATGYSVATLTVDGSSMTPTTSYTFNNVITNHTITATFGINSYPLTYNGGIHGTISGSALQSVPYLSSGTTVTAVASNGYAFTSWSDGVKTAVRTDIALVGGTNVTAHYSTNNYTLTYNAGNGGSISGITPQTVAYLSTGSQVTAVASNGYAFTSWSDGLTTSKRTDVALIGGTNVTASFVTTCTSPVIVGGIDPGSAALTAFGPLVLTLTNVTGSADLAYQWFSNSVAILNATNSSYTNLSVVVADAGNYDCVVTNDCGSVTSSVVVVTINPATPITQAATTASAINYGQTLGSSTITVGTFTNALGQTVAISSYGFVDSSIAPNAGTTNITVYYLPTDSTNYANLTNTVSVSVIPASTFVAASATENPSGYRDSVSYIAALPANATGNVIFSSTNGAFSSNTVSSGTASSLSISNLTRGTNLITVAYLGDGNYLGSTNTLNQIVTNHPPVANSAAYTRNAAIHQIKIAVANLLSNATDVDNDSLSLASVSATTNAATLIVSGGWVLYYNTNAVADEFTYTVSDGFGGTNSATVTVNVDSTPLFGQATIPAVDTTSGAATLTFAGIPTYSYSVLRSTNLTSWTVLWTTNAPAGGVFEYIDNPAPQPSAYYRLQYNP